MLRGVRIPFLRRKSLKVKMERRWLRDKDRYAQSKTNEPPLHPWFTKGRAFEILKEEERLRNLHPGSIKYNAEIIEEFTRKGEEYELYKTHKMIQDTAEVKSLIDAQNQAMEHASTLPAHLAKEMQKHAAKYNQPPETEQESFYWTQISKIIPAELQRNWGLAQRIDDISDDRIPFHEE